MSASLEAVDKFEAAQLLISFQQQLLTVDEERAATSVIDVGHENEDEPSVAAVTAAAGSGADNRREWSSALRKAAGVVLRGEMPKRWACNEYNVDFDDLEACLKTLREEDAAAAVNANQQEEANDAALPSVSSTEETSDTVAVAPTIFRCQKCPFVTSIEQSLEIHAASAHRETPASPPPLSKPRRSFTVTNTKQQGKKTKESAKPKSVGLPVRSASLKLVVTQKKKTVRQPKRIGRPPTKGGCHTRELIIEVERVKQATAVAGRNTGRGSTTSIDQSKRSRSRVSKKSVTPACREFTIMLPPCAPLNTVSNTTAVKKEAVDRLEIGAGASLKVGAGVGASLKVGAGVGASLKVGAGVGASPKIGAGASPKVGAGVGASMKIGAGASLKIGAGVGASLEIGAGASLDDDDYDKCENNELLRCVRDCLTSRGETRDEEDRIVHAVCAVLEGKAIVDEAARVYDVEGGAIRVLLERVRGQEGRTRRPLGKNKMKRKVTEFSAKLMTARSEARMLSYFSRLMAGGYSFPDGFAIHIASQLARNEQATAANSQREQLIRRHFTRRWWNDVRASEKFQRLVEARRRNC